MPSWEKPPKDIFELLNEYVGEHYPGTSLACGPDRRVIHVSNDTLSQVEFARFVDDLQTRFPGAF